MNYYTELAGDWWTRWRTTVQTPLSGDHLERMLALPIDYYVFKRGNIVGTSTVDGRLSAKPAFSNSEFTVYDANSLRILPGRLTLTSRTRSTM